MKATRPQAGAPAQLLSLGVRALNRAADALLGVDSQEVLNPDVAAVRVERPGAVLKQAANAIRAQAISPGGKAVDYAGLAGSQAYADFRELTQALPLCTLADLGGQADRVAFWINLYNTLVLDAVIHYQIQDSLLDDRGFFRRAAYNVGGMRFSADDIEHGVLRGNRRHPLLPFPAFGPADPRLPMVITRLDPRLHFALVCGARSCPPIAFYDGERLDEQLDQAAASFIQGEGTRFEPERQILWLSPIFQWYAGDFGGRRGVLKLLGRYLPNGEARDALHDADLRVRYLEYDWSVNAAV